LEHCGSLKIKVFGDFSLFSFEGEKLLGATLEDLLVGGSFAYFRLLVEQIVFFFFGKVLDN
jgi:hypothetical protein